MRRKLWLLLTVAAAALLLAAPALAQDHVTHVYGLVFYDTNMNGVWDMGEKGVPDVPVKLEAGDGDTTFELMSSASETCTNLDITGPTQMPCVGTFGLVPAGETGTYWKVTITVPSGHNVTSANPQWVQSEAVGGSSIVQFGLAPTGAGGQALPVTGVPYELYAAVAMLVAGAGLTLRSFRRK